MSLSQEHVEFKISAKIKTYILTRAELLFSLCYEIPCTTYLISVLLNQDCYIYLYIEKTIFIENWTKTFHFVKVDFCESKMQQDKEGC